MHWHFALIVNLNTPPDSVVNFQWKAQQVMVDSSPIVAHVIRSRQANKVRAVVPMLHIYALQSCASCFAARAPANNGAVCFYWPYKDGFFREMNWRYFPSLMSDIFFV
ncbi:hypothetical protein TcWFU_007940 [Taenia crassiceps]|uniref:Uncharacterized protein n=1 Tax=Taenia crassiceps TaxID=6207 RepID=A0ABR4QIB5_9CEST